MIDFNRLGYTIIVMSRAVCPDIECIDIVIQQTIIKKQKTYKYRYTYF